METELSRIETVAWLGAHQLEIGWKDGHTDRVDLAGWVKTGGEILKPLALVENFKGARVGDYGASVDWDQDGDLAIDAFHVSQIAQLQRPLAPGEVRDWQERLGLSNNESADFVGVTVSTWKEYRAGASIPEPVQVLCRAAERDPVIVSARLKPRRTGRPAKESA
jgi:hypothetical protein